MGLYLPEIDPPTECGNYFSMVDAGDAKGDISVVTIWRKTYSGEFQSVGFSPIQEIVTCKDCVHQPYIQKTVLCPDGQVMYRDDVCPWISMQEIFDLPILGNNATWFCPLGEKGIKECSD